MIVKEVSSLNNSIAPIIMGIPFGITKTGNWVMLLTIDIGRWSHFAEFTFEGFNELKNGDLNIQKHL